MHQQGRTSTSPAFSALGTVLLRMAVLPYGALEDRSWKAPRFDASVPLDELTAYVTALAAHPALDEAVELSSTSLSALTRALRAGERPERRKLERAAVSLTKYALRMTGRPTPFGTFAGVTAARLGSAGEAAGARVGAGHRKFVRPDAGWFSAVAAEQIRTERPLRDLRVVWNDLCYARGDRMYSPWAASVERNTSRMRHLSVRAGRQIGFVRDRAAAPVDAAALAADLAASLAMDTAAAERTVRRLVDLRFLLASLVPFVITTDSLSDLGAACELLEHLGTAREALDGYAQSAVGEGRAELSTALAALRAVRPFPRPPVQVDLKMDASVTLPQAVGRELEECATTLWRLSPRTGTTPRMADYTKAFQERYGLHHAVPLTDVTHPGTGLGLPTASPGGTAGARRRPTELPERLDAAVGELVQDVTLHGAREIVLDAETTGRLERAARLPAADAARVPPDSLELHAQLLAADVAAVARGDFRLVLSRYAESEAAGVSTGRFAGLIGTTTVGSLIGAPQSAGVIRAQVRFEPDSPRHLNVCQVPDVLPYQLPIGVHADRGRPGVIDWREIDIVADEDRLRLVWHRTGEEVVPVRPHMLGIHTAPPVARFLFEVAAAGAAAWSPWRWGWSEVLPFLPRVRHGRVIVRPARWRPTARLLEAAAVADGAWPAEVERWRERWDVPRFVQIASEDETCPLDLENALHLRMFRQELTSRDVDICEDLTASPSSFGWLSGHANEVIVSLVRREPAPEARRPRVLAHASRASAPHPPGGEWLYAKIYAAAEDHSQILTGRLARLADNIAGLTDRCFYTRYRDPDPHLRFRVHGDPEVLLGSVLPALRECVEQLHAERLVRHFSLDTYTPEEHRYGGRAAMSHAEEVFALDSRSAVRLMRLSASGALPLPGPVLAAVHYGVLLDALGDWPWWEWVDAAFPNVEAHRRYYRAHRVLARAWITPGRCLETLVRGTGADDLERLWNASPAPRAYGALVLGNSADARTATAVDGLLHMQHNRLVGIGPEQEALSHAVLRGIAREHAGRLRHR